MVAACSYAAATGHSSLTFEEWSTTVMQRTTLSLCRAILIATKIGVSSPNRLNSVLCGNRNETPACRSLDRYDGISGAHNGDKSHRPEGDSR